MEDVQSHNIQRDSLGNARVWWRRIAIVMLCCAVALSLGYFQFVSKVTSYDTPDPSSINADGIVVLTGGFARLGPAVELLKNKSGERLLVSGVNRATSDNLLKNVLNVEDSLYDCCVDIDQDALDTIGNAVGTAHWAISKEYMSVIVVTNDYHMPRSLMELRRTMDDVELVPYPVRNLHDANEPWYAKLDRYRVLTGEYGKYLASIVRGIVRANSSVGAASRAGLSTGW